MSTKSDNKMQRYYAERETTGPEFGKFGFSSIYDNGKPKHRQSKSLNQPPKNKNQCRTNVLECLLRLGVGDCLPFWRRTAETRDRF